jgi:acyl-CoA reductase-like NAD-dependent aldehyde dehydrogenase
MTRHPIIAGSEQPGNAGGRPVIDPFDASELGSVSYADANQALGAIAGSLEAYSRWKFTPAHERAAILSRASALIREQKETLALTITREAGKPILASRIEVDRAAFTFQSAAEAAKHAHEGEVIDMSVAASGVGRTGSFRYFPIGVVLAITPFNFPLNLVAHKLAPAFAVGNTVVLKPAPQTPLTSFLLADILREAGLPEGVLSVVPCENEVAEQMVKDERVAFVSFTGSDTVGWKIKALAPRARVALELGGNGCVIVDEITERDSLIQSLSTAAFNYAGQICISLQHLLVKRKYYQDVLGLMIAKAESIVVGDPKQETTVVGPMISEDAAKKVEAWIMEAVSQGARRHTGEYRESNWITPTVLTDVAPATTIYQNEAFAPVVIVQPYDTLDEAIDIVNASKYGLQAGLFSNDIRAINRAYERLELGGLIVNDTNAFRLDTMPYGGVKASGLGREGIRFTMKEMSDIKMLVLKA